MVKKKKRKPVDAATPPHGGEPPREKPLRVARALSIILALAGAVMLFLGVGVLTGAIEEGWGFPMSEVPNWGRPWGGVMMVAGLAYVVAPILLWIKPSRGSVALMVVAGLSVLVGTPVIATTTEIFYNLFQDTKSRPVWVDSVWGYYMILNVAICVALYRAYPPRDSDARRNGAS